MIEIWVIVLALFFLLHALWDIWYKRRRGFIDWWYTEIDRRPGSGGWYYRSRTERINRLRE